MEDNRGIPEIPPAARNFFDQHRPIGNEFNSAGRDNDRDGEIDNADDNDEAEGRRDAEGDPMVEAPEVDENPGVANSSDPEAIAPPAQHFAHPPEGEGYFSPAGSYKGND